MKNLNSALGLSKAGDVCMTAYVNVCKFIPVTNIRGFGRVR